MQQDEERQDRRTRTSAAGWQTGSEIKFDAVQNVRYLTSDDQGGNPGYTPSGRLGCSADISLEI